MIRVGKIIYKQGKKIIPSYTDFEIVEVMTKSSKYGELSSYELRDDQNRIMENIWQGSKVYEKVRETVCTYSKYDPTVVWNYHEETHVDAEDTLKDEYFVWRKKLQNNPYAVRYPVGFNYMKECICAFKDDEFDNPLDYIEARKAIYVPIYTELVKKCKKFKVLKEKLSKGVNLLICEVDGPHQESLDYYIEKYHVNSTFIESNTIMATRENLNIMLNDDKHPYGHGYCLASALSN